MTSINYNFSVSGFLNIDLTGTSLFSVLQSVEKFSDTSSMFESQIKQLGTMTLKDGALKDKILQAIKNEPKITAVLEEIGIENNPTVVKMLRTIGAQKAMGWHRDSYIDGDKLIGPFPASVKLMIFLSSHTTGSAVFRVMEGTHRFLPKRYLLTKIYSLIGRKRSFEASPGLGVLFDMRLIHSRSKSLQNGYRSVVIVSY